MATLFRQSPLNAIWEGSGNVIALDVLRAHKSFPILLQDIKQAAGCDPGLDRLVKDLEDQIHSISSNFLSVNAQQGARNLADKLALAFQASILIRFGDETVSDAPPLFSLLSDSVRLPELT
jgi:putative acyl-CoA dehydrogenase